MHDLRLRQRKDGEEHAIEQISSLGYVLPGDAGAWYASTHTMLANAFRRPNAVLDWWIHDADTGEDTPWNPDAAALADDLRRFREGKPISAR